MGERAIDKPSGDDRQFFDISAFQAPGDGFICTAKRINGAGPGFFGLDMSVHKEFEIRERFRPTFHADMVNLPNIPAFAAPNQSRGDGAFGTIGSTLGGSTGREIQLSLRLAW